MFFINLLEFSNIKLQKSLNFKGKSSNRLSQKLKRYKSITHFTTENIEIL